MKRKQNVEFVPIFLKIPIGNPATEFAKRIIEEDLHSLPDGMWTGFVSRNIVLNERDIEHIYPLVPFQIRQALTAQVCDICVRAWAVQGRGNVQDLVKRLCEMKGIKPDPSCCWTRSWRHRINQFQIDRGEFSSPVRKIKFRGIGNLPVVTMICNAVHSPGMDELKVNQEVFRKWF